MNINDYLDQPDKVCYELWGEDMFSYETYCIGLYASNSSANRARRIKEERNAQTQSEGLRDQMWIQRTTVGEHLEMLRKEQELNMLTHDKIDCITNTLRLSIDHLKTDTVDEIVESSIEFRVHSFNELQTVIDHLNAIEGVDEVIH